MKHYAGSVVYCTLTFVEKNKDEVPKEATTLLQKSTIPLLARLFSDTVAVQSSKQAVALSSNVSGRRLSSKPCSSTVTSLNSVASQFKDQLSGLMEKIYSTIPHYIRCLKPNDENVPDSFNRLRITEQLRYGGVLEAVRVARSGFPVRLSHIDFFLRYRSLAPPYCTAATQLSAAIPAQLIAQSHPHSNTQSFGPEKAPHSAGPMPTGPSLRSLCELLLASLWEEFDSSSVSSIHATPSSKSKKEEQASWTGKMPVGKESVQLGLTKVFLRKAAHDILEGRRSRRLLAAAKRLQARFRGHRAHARYLRICESARILQRVVRGMFARLLATRIRHSRCAVRLQSVYRAYLCRRRYLAFRRVLNILQKRFRTRQKLKSLRQAALVAQVINLQRILRGWKEKRKWRRFRRAVVTLQNRLRKTRARAILRALRIQAKDVGRLKQSNEALKAEIEALKAKAEADNRRMQQELELQLQQQAEKQKARELQVLRDELEKALSLLEAERKLRMEVEAKLRKAESQRAALEAELVDSEGKLFRSDEALKAASKKIVALEANISKTRSLSASTATVSVAMAPPKQQSDVPNGDMTKLQEEVKREQQQNRILQEECRRSAIALEKEASARKLLDDELKRLRQMSVEYKFQLDALRKGGSNNSTIVTAPDSANNGSGTAVVSPVGVGTSNAQSLEALVGRKLTSAEEEKLSQSGTVARRNRNIAEKAAQFEAAAQSQQSRAAPKADSEDKTMRQLQVDAGNGRLLVGRNSISASVSSFDEDLSAGVSVPTSPSVDQLELASAMSTFEKNLESFRAKLKTVG